MSAEMYQIGLRQVFVWLTVLLAMSLVGCAGTVKHVGEAPTGSEQRVQGVSKVVVQSTPEVKARLGDSGRFNHEELAGRIRSQLTTKGLIGTSANQYVDVVVTDVRVRSTFNAIMFGFMAGDDHVNGRIRLKSDAGQELRAFDINASYALGGFGGGQDGTRMTWLYEKFSELAVQELEKLVSVPGSGSPAEKAQPTPMTVPTSVTVKPASTALSSQSVVQAPTAEPPPAVSKATGIASVSTAGVATTGGAVVSVHSPAYVADKVLENSEVAHKYQIYLSRPNPKAFAVSSTGGWWMAWGESLNPMVKETIAQRALRGCQERSQAPCVLYAVDDKVVYGQGSGGKH